MKTRLEEVDEMTRKEHVAVRHMFLARETALRGLRELAMLDFLTKSLRYMSSFELRKL